MRPRRPRRAWGIGLALAFASGLLAAGFFSLDRYASGDQMLRQDSSARALTMGPGTAQAKAPGPPALDQQQPANLKTATFAMG